MDSKLLAIIIAVAKKEASANKVDISNLQRTVEEQLKEFHKRSPILDTPTFSVVDGCLCCKWDFGPTLNLGNIVGPKGDKGDRGDKGLTGSDGPRGEKGNTGDKGSNGSNGSDGAPGRNGKDGINGKDGLRGAVGPAGERGAPGGEGTPGKDGKDAVAPPAGADGKDGLDGYDGVGIDKAWVDDKYHLKFNMSSGVVMDAGYVRGPAGLNASKGGRVTGGGSGGGGSNFYLVGAGYNDSCELILTNSNGSTVNAGRDNVACQIVYVTEASQLSGALDSNKLYFLDGEINMGTTSIIVPPTGLSVAGHGFGISGLVSTEDNHTLFVTAGGTYSGDLYLTSLDISCTGVGSKVFDIDNQENLNASEWNTVNFLNCTSLGEIKNYRQGLCRNIAWVSCKDGLTMTGAWAGGWAAVDSIVVGAPLTGVLFRAGAGLLIGGSFRTDMNILQLGTAGGIFCDFSPANITLDGGFSVANLRANPDANNFPNMPNTSVKARYRDCAGVRNTYVGASGTITTSVETVIATSGVYYSMEGSLSVDEPTWLILFEDAGIEFNSNVTTAFELSGSFSFAGLNNQVLSLQLYKYTAATTTWAAASPPFQVTMNAADRAENVSFGTFVDMTKGDRLEFRIANIGATGNITALLGGQVRLSER